MKDYKNCLTIIMMLFFTIVFSCKPYAQMANGQSKFVGNIMRSEVPDNYDTYWNQVTPENSGKWGVVEGTRGVMNWTDLDLAYNYAQQNNFPFKQHTLVWGAQAPSWIDGLTASEQAAEIEEWIVAYAQRYPNTEMIDVVNEPLHVIPSFKDAIGGDGVTGWDWVIWSFEKARQYNPNAILILNDYSIIGNRRNTSSYIEIINLLKDRGLIDGIGLQSHGLEYARINTINSTLNDLAATGIPLYISELDLDFENDSDQLNKMQELWPLLYENPAVAGITLWGYEKGKHWKPNAYLIGDGGTVGSWIASTVFEDYTTTGTGNLQVAFTNDSANNANDLEVDYVIIDGVTYQAEDMPINTGVYQNNSCGGSFSQIMNCDGYIQFPSVSQNITIRAKGLTGNETMEANVVNPNIERPALTWLREVYFGGTPSNNAPLVSITNPSNGSIFTESTNVLITANATDNDGTIAKVDFYVDGILIASDSSSPYETNFIIGVGTYSLSAIAFDNEGLSTTSSIVNITGQSEGGGSTIMYVQSISTGVVGVGKGNKKAKATITIVDEFGSPVSNANVVGTFSGTFNETISGVTQSNGTVVLLSNSSAKGTIISHICVDTVSHTTLIYDDLQNVITCTNGGTSNKSASGSNKNGGSDVILIQSDDKLSISSSEEIVQSIRVYNILGKVLFTQKNVPQKVTQIYDYDFTFNKNQLYILHIKTKSNLEIKKIIKR
jgi:endo-1,4-beta-xylanase